ncbi:MAG: NAD(P)/FAD-dependent oxidoreductase, partial [Candidatus Aminicenantes bacterium]|nr:NAD(P)/FAD-dependent oxidoreductase [Candidatus Aminicenantes bacterium]
GGLSCAAAFARQGFKTLVLELHDKPGGYATAFKRPGGFVFDASLHSTGAGEREGIRNLISGFPEITEVEFVEHPNLYRAIFPDHDITVPNRDLEAYIKHLCRLYPEEEQGIKGIFEDMKGLGRDVAKISAAQDQVDMSRFPKEYPYLFKGFNKTWGSMLDARVKDPKLKAIISAQWGYYGLPPSKLSSFYYALPAIGYLEDGGFYPVGRSQKISDAFVNFIVSKGGKVLLKTPVDKILTKDHAAIGVQTEQGATYTGKVVVSNANAFDTFGKMLDEGDYLKDLHAKMEKLSVSFSSFLVFLGLNKDLVKEVGIKDSEIFFFQGYDFDADYEGMLKADFSSSEFGLSIYDNIYDGYSPEGKNTLGIIALQGYDHWEQYAEDYWKGDKADYRKEKERMADILIQKVEESLLPGLSQCIAVKEIGTPLTNIRYTRNFRGAVYGWNQTVDNSVPRRFPHKTPIKNLYLSGAWTSPGHGYGGVLSSGLECFAEIMKTW